MKFDGVEVLHLMFISKTSDRKTHYLTDFMNFSEMMMSNISTSEKLMHFSINKRSDYTNILNVDDKVIFKHINVLKNRKNAVFCQKS